MKCDAEQPSAIGLGDQPTPSAILQTPRRSHALRGVPSLHMPALQPSAARPKRLDSRPGRIDAKHRPTFVRSRGRAVRSHALLASLRQLAAMVELQGCEIPSTLSDRVAFVVSRPPARPGLCFGYMQRYSQGRQCRRLECTWIVCWIAVRPLPMRHARCRSVSGLIVRPASDALAC